MKKKSVINWAVRLVSLAAVPVISAGIGSHAMNANAAVQSNNQSNEQTTGTNSSVDSSSNPSDNTTGTSDQSNSISTNVQSGAIRVFPVVGPYPPLKVTRKMQSQHNGSV